MNCAMGRYTIHYKNHLKELLKAARAKDYAGYSKFDALNSPQLKAATLNNKWLQLLFTQAVKGCPVNIRPLLCVRKSRNPKGIALFARSYLFLHEKTGGRISSNYLREAVSLLRWLLDNSSPNLRRTAEKLIACTVNRRTDYHAWYLHASPGEIADNAACLRGYG